MAGGVDNVSTVKDVASQLQLHSDRFQNLEESLKTLTTEVRSLSTDMITVKESLSTISLFCQRFGFPTNSILIHEASSDQESNAIGGELIHKSEKKLESVLGVITAMDTDEEADDSLAFELIPSYFYEEDDDSFELNLIPPFFFIENEGVDSLHGVGVQSEEIAKSDTNVFSELIQVKIDRVKDFEMHICFNFLEEFCKNPEYLKELFFHHNKLLFLDWVLLHLDDTRCIFDRGKCTMISSLTYETYETLLLPLLLSLGYASDLMIVHSFPRFCVNDFAILDAKKIFVQMPVRDGFLFLLFARVIAIETSFANLARSKVLIVLDNNLNCKDFVTILVLLTLQGVDYTRSLTDQGKDMELSLRTSCSTRCSEIVSQIDVCLKFLDVCYRAFVPVLILEHNYWSASWSQDVFSATWQMLGKMFPIDIVCSSVKSLHDGRVFDLGKGFELLARYCNFDECLTLLDGYYRRLVQDLLEFQFICSGVVLLVKDDSFDSVNSQIDKAAKTDAYVIVKISQIHIVQVSCAELESLKDYFFNDVETQKLLGKKYFSLASDYFRSLFDHGKAKETGEKNMSCVAILGFTFRHQMNVWVTDFMLPRLVTPSDINDSSNLHVKLTRRGNYTNNLLAANGGNRSAYALADEVLTRSVCSPMLLLWLDSDVCFYQWFTQLLQVLNSDGDLLEFCVPFVVANLYTFRYMFNSANSLMGVLSGIQVLLLVSQILNVLLWVGYLKWKFKLFSTGWCSVRNVKRVDNNFISVGGLDINWNYKGDWFREAEVHKQIVVVLLRKQSWDLSTLMKVLGTAKGWRLEHNLLITWQVSTVHVPNDIIAMCRGGEYELVHPNLLATYTWMAIMYSLQQFSIHFTTVGVAEIKFFLIHACVIPYEEADSVQISHIIASNRNSIVMHIGPARAPKGRGWETNFDPIFTNNVYPGLVSLATGTVGNASSICACQAENCDDSEHDYCWEPSTYKFSSMIEFLGDTTTLCGHLSLRLIRKLIARLGIQVLGSLTGVIMRILATYLVMLVGGNYNYCGLTNMAGNFQMKG